MEHHLGRGLAASELVHHCDGNPHNNRLDNLMLVSRAEHTRLHKTLPEPLFVCAHCGQVFAANRHKDRRLLFDSVACFKAYRSAHGLKDLRPPRKTALPA
jgi:hypothetical protein